MWIIVPNFSVEIFRSGNLSLSQRNLLLYLNFAAGDHGMQKGSDTH